jgi:hypothetical protein
MLGRASPLFASSSAARTPSLTTGGPEKVIGVDSGSPLTVDGTSTGMSPNVTVDSSEACLS